MTGCFRALCVGVLLAFVGALEPKHLPLKTNLTIDLTPIENIVKESKYNGRVEIEFNVSPKNEPYSSIDINAFPKYIKFDKSNVRMFENDMIQIGIQNVISSGEIYTITFNKNLFANRTYVIMINFEGKTGEDTIRYTEEIMYTNFPLGRPHYIFPCFNENQEKTPFELSVFHKKEWSAYAYMEGTRKQNGLKTETHFQTSEQRLSTYSIGFVLVKGYTEVQAEKNVTFVVKKNNTVPDFLKKCSTIAPFSDFVQEVESEIDIHIIAVPSHYTNGFFASTLNLILAEESLIKLDDEMTTDEKVKLCSDILTALAEQFFGVLVTSNDKNGNSVIINSIFPRYLGNNAFGEMSSVFTDDLIRARQAMIMEEAIKRETSVKFGAAALDMLDNNTKNDLLEFFKERLEYNSANRQNFENFLANRTDLKKTEITKWLDEIVSSNNMPLVVNVETDKDGNAVIKCPQNLVVNVMYLNDKMEEENVICNVGSTIKTTSKWIIANYNGSGLYRVYYESGIRKMLAQNMSTWGMETRTRLLSDAFWWGNQRQTESLFTVYDLESALDFSLYLINEYNLAPWKISNEGFYNIKRLFFLVDGKDSRRAEFMKTAKGLLSYVTKYLGFNQVSNDLDEIKSLRETILLANRNLDEEVLIANLSQIYDQVRKYIKKPSDFGPDTLYPAFISYMHKGMDGNKEWPVFFQKYDSSLNSFQKRRLFNGFADCISPIKFLNATYNMSGDRDLAFSFLISKPQQIGPILNNWVKYGKQEFETKGMISLLAEMVRKMAPVIYNTKFTIQLKKIETNCINPLGDTLCGPLTKAIEAAVKTIDKNGEFLKINEKSLMNWCKNAVPDVPVTQPPLTTQTGPTVGPTTNPTSGTGKTGSDQTGGTKVTVTTPTSTTPSGVQGIYTHQVHLIILLASALHIGFLIF